MIAIRRIKKQPEGELGNVVADIRQLRRVALDDRQVTESRSSRSMGVMPLRLLIKLVCIPGALVPDSIQDQ